MTGAIEQINISNGGVPKSAIEAAHVSEGGIDGDHQRDTKHHGGPDRALCLFPVEAIDAMRADGHPIAPGTTGENITTRGLDWSRVVPGARLRLGAHVLIEVTGYTTPCKNIAASFSDGDMNRMNVKRDPTNSRVYARVLQQGDIRAGDTIELIEAAEAVR